MKKWDDIEHGEDRIEVFDSLAEARARFGENYRGYVFRLTRAQIEALLQGRVVAFDIGGREYAGFLVLKESAND
ncbi:MAG: hypothetical protein A3F84_03905 [Candidatus Handelsmanbacteria bacterium RIFCSPLOWO2_12_FULL_64_10]|uniref:Uncharacterized protein n=1 Tax=Handelsmanbacteria sp. (strain RIFCSPLOWO2_12_FULL_64_10) TaxID=1817868 RepID=A0A1F6CSW0_HANXR|nr:MAG: hypothetical protein A3F84_03905 [Candidatus Handelsmanbacteria bacterium RIFCSPLOWO2_12_FULL_64_10]